MAILKRVSESFLSGGDQRVARYTVVHLSSEKKPSRVLAEGEIALEVGMEFIPYFATDVQQLLFLSQMSGSLALGTRASTELYLSARITSVEFDGEHLLVYTQNAAYVATLEPFRRHLGSEKP